MRIGVLISGRGSNLKALIDACEEPGFRGRIALVISNRPGAAGLAVAEAAGIPTAVIDHKEFSTRETFDAELHRALTKAGVELVCNAGFMRILSDGFVEKWRDRQLNIHPSLLPAFKGLHVHQRALDAGVKITGCTVHFVRPEMDEGPIVAQAAVPVLPGDTAETLSQRVLEAEHKLYPLALKLVVEERARVVDENVRIDYDGATVGGPLFVPAG
ncbi:phosphoribosylglycinamide formyltransferase [Parvibaculum sp.]|uniref:phosphoribosylglycinamide formyltransferase n=1 Tax=Parvibaculum sp. TaxID=2024848 RepID=UPI001B0DF1D7|nr:phosphoribosylglycinamide formyltransferase [Parvibaculum sp.]MBO6633850.1 phosphoribosylglycinamide formyltransferase [Parvibaculum sp.]MBO6678938.1 phosphoribosylglycinamide formyltransferase [Parvibaculum sp.]MBO6685545.1 phosphoribosylglycinamide formyltransferase [Parvibaculum sp.]MBO6904348.1 phosphoribosylglycinamide formyltransferase [Parvibaculum sp.]